MFGNIFTISSASGRARVPMRNIIIKFTLPIYLHVVAFMMEIFVLFV